MTQYAGSESPSSSSPDSGSIPAFVDWLVGAGIALVGLVLTGVGSVLTTVADRDLITDAVRDFGTQSTFLTEQETIDVAVPTLHWTGIGLLVAGLVLLVGAAAYVYSQRRARQRAGVEGRVGGLRANAVAGAVAALVLSFVPFSQALGGAIAGYLEASVSGKSTRAGAASGLVGVLPALVIVPFVLVGIAGGASAIGDQGLTLMIGGVVFVALLFGTALAAGLGALGGYVGGAMADESR